MEHDVWIHVDWELTEVESGSHLTHTMPMRPAWFLVPVMAIMWPLMMRTRAQDALDETMTNVKRIVEAA